jgi:hypothetical protein
MKKNEEEGEGETISETDIREKEFEKGVTYRILRKLRKKVTAACSVTLKHQQTSTTITLEQQRNRDQQTNRHTKRESV